MSRNTSISYARSAVTAAVALALALATAGCAATQATTPRSRVAKDLGCTTEGTGVRKLEAIPGRDAARWEVSGCGRTAIYVCTTPVRDCWREGQVQAPEGQAAPLEAPAQLGSR